jgi:flavin reductase (DIM6/NTAB) family NADH-FMN oxidoreductase RutF
MKKNMGPITPLFPSPVVVVGTYDNAGKPNVMTAAWAGICCSEPPCIQVSIRKSRFSHVLITEKRAFTLNIPPEQMAAEADFIGMASGRDRDKFGTTGLTPVKGELVDAPLVGEFPIGMECRLLKVVELGSHDLFVGEVLATWVDEEKLNEQGKPDPLKVRPLFLMPVEGNYYGVGSRIARSFEAGKNLLG